MTNSKLKILLKNLQDAQNLTHTHFLFWSYNEFEAKEIFKDNPKKQCVTSHNAFINKDPLPIKTELRTTLHLEKNIKSSVEISNEENIKKSSWDLFPMALNSSTISLPITKFSCLKNKIISSPKILCAILTNIQDKNEILFLERLAKIITKSLLSCQIIHLHKKEDLITQINKFPLNLVPIKEIVQHGIKAKVHQQFVLNTSTILPLENIKQYMSNILLKQDLWKQLNQITLPNTQK